MKRVVGSTVLLVVMVALMLAPALFYGGGDDADGAESTTITDYRAEFTVDADGGLDAVERLTVDFPTSDKHGIFRFFDRLDPSRSDVRDLVDGVSVTRDGSAETYDESVEGEGRYDVLKIGDPDRNLEPGEHVYVIKYHVPTVVGPATDVSQRSQFYWQLIPAGWQQQIRHAELTVNLPAEAGDVQCAIGTGDGDPCGRLRGDGTRTITVRTGALPDHTPVTLIAGLDVDAPDPAVTRPWAPRFDTVFGTQTALGVVAVLALLAAAVGWVMARTTYERPPGFPLQYAPPDGIGPAQGTYILKETFDDKEVYLATLMFAAERGAVELKREGDDAWTITDAGGAEKWNALDPVTRRVAKILSGPGSSFRIQKSDVTAGKRLQSEVDAYEAEVKDWARRDNLLVTAGIGGWATLLVLGAFLLVGLAVFWNPFGMTMLGLVPAAFAVGGLPVLGIGTETKRTPAGRDLWSRVGGFHRILSTPSAQDRFEFSGRQELYTAYLPWAVAFGCADEWAAKYRYEVGAEPPTPTWFYGGYAAGSFASSVDTMVADFDSTLSGAISSYQATQSSSSSGGGGFSGGGGGGGGGGGSW